MSKISVRTRLVGMAFLAFMCGTALAYTGSAVSGLFTIDNRDPAISVASPNGGETLIAGGSYAITWSSAGYISDVLIEYSTNGGAAWVAENTVPNTESYDWLVPEVSSDQCLVRISDASNPGVNDISAGVFTITSPNGLPDLTVTSEDIGFDTLEPDPCELVTIEATVRNVGRIAAENVEVVFKDFDEIIGSQVISRTAPGDCNTVSMEHTWPEAGFRLITVIVDPFDDIGELDETNNSAAKLYQVGDVGDMNAVIEVFCDVPAELPAGATANISGEAFYKIEVAGEPDYVYAVKGGWVSIEVLDSNGLLENFMELYTNTDGRFSATCNVSGAGGDCYDVNIAVTDITLEGTWQGSFCIKSKRDLWIDQITFADSAPDVLIEADVCASSENTATEPNVPVSFYFHPPQSGSQIDATQQIAEILPGSNEIASVIWSDPPDGLYCITAELGPGYSDDNNANNALTRALAVGPEPDHIDIVIEIPAEVNASDVTDVNVLVTNNNGNVMIPCLLETLTLDINGVDERQVDLKPYFDWEFERYIYAWQPPTDANGPACLNVTAQSVDISGKVISGAGSACTDVNDNAPPNFSISASPYWAKIGQSVRITVNVSELLLNDHLDFAVKDSADQNIPSSPADPCHPTPTRWIYQISPLPEGVAFGRATISVEGADVQGRTGSGQGHFYVVEEVPDFGVYSEDIEFFDANGLVDTNPEVGETITIEAEIHASAGNTVTGPYIPVTFHARHPAGDYVIGQTQTGEIPPGESDSVSVDWTNAAGGWYVIEVELGPDFPDRNASNNRATTRALPVGFECGPVCDLNCDGTVDFSDVARLAEDWLGSGSIADIYPPVPDGDEIVDFFDFAQCAQNWKENIE